ncbi:MAG: hypothetical protein HON04_14190 [Planctomicrobium sp.]|jgi:hypothetical protein|nr:hypothetical protein [Planctomicrobium sp.]
MNWFCRSSSALLSNNTEAKCSLCLRSYQVAGPFVEWQEKELMCEKCLLHCLAILDTDKVQRGLVPDRSGQARKRASRQKVLSMVEEKRFGCLAKALNSSLNERVILRNEDVEDSVIVQHFLRTVASHLELLSLNDEDAEHSENNSGSQKEDLDAYFQAWLGLGAFGIYHDVLQDLPHP